ncbi:cupin domain-containing protein [Microbacterium karelineae]|uniref:cupin domain-containing protein n=1 Tax=Microbacterium karelineae TaxID=2654283 RepID=UPI0012EAB954|nr:cupin domain-containing protein [Microbacterium karelineae]
MSDHLELPGGVSTSILRVYDWEAADGEHGGSPHFHTVSREGYVVIGGAGRVQTLTAGGSRETPLEKGRVVTFDPGTIHRLVNDGGLEIVTLMQNAGLPESGDAVFTFPLEVLASVDDYRAAAALPEDPDRRGEAARARRDLALAGFAELRGRAEEVGARAALAPYYERAAAIVADRIDRWRETWRRGPLAQAERTGAQLDALARGDGSHLIEATVGDADAAPAEAWGMCGRLTVFPDLLPC